MAIKKASWILGAFFVVLTGIWVAWTLYNATSSNEKKTTALEAENALVAGAQQPEAISSKAVSSLVSGFSIQRSKINTWDSSTSNAVAALNQISVINKASVQMPRSLDVVSGAVPVAQQAKGSSSRVVNVTKVSRLAI